MTTPCSCRNPAGCSGVPFPADAICMGVFTDVLKAVESYASARASISQLAAQRRDVSVQHAAFAASEQRLVELKLALAALPLDFTPAAPPPPPAV